LLLLHLEAAESADLDVLAVAQRLGDGIEETFHDHLGVDLRQAGPVGDRVDDVFFGDVSHSGKTYSTSGAVSARGRESWGKKAGRQGEKGGGREGGEGREGGRAGRREGGKGRGDEPFSLWGLPPV